MALTNLYVPIGKIRRSDKNWEEGVTEIGGAEKVASLWQVYEERLRRMDELGANFSGGVREGVIIVPDGYDIIKPGRALVREGLPLFDPKSAIEANRSGKWYSPDVVKPSARLSSILRAAFPIDEARVTSNVLELMLANFETDPVACFLFGGEGTNEQITARVKQVKEYLVREFANAKKLNQCVDVFLPGIGSAKEEIVGTQIFSGGLASDFVLDGDTRALYRARGVFGAGD